jgi:hypothetical protein
LISGLRSQAARNCLVPSEPALAAAGDRLRQRFLADRRRDTTEEVRSSWNAWERRSIRCLLETEICQATQCQGGHPNRPPGQRKASECRKSLEAVQLLGGRGRLPSARVEHARVADLKGCVGDDDIKVDRVRHGVNVTAVIGLGDPVHVGGASGPAPISGVACAVSALGFGSLAYTNCLATGLKGVQLADKFTCTARTAARSAMARWPLALRLGLGDRSR